MTYFRAVRGALLPILFFCCVFLETAPTMAVAAPETAEPGAVAAWLGEMGDRREGSAAEVQVFAALRTWFSSRSDFHEAAFQRLDGEHSFSRQIWFRIPGKVPGELVVVVPTDGKNHRGIAWAAAWADKALVSGSEVSLTFLFTGGERGRGESAGLGSRTFLADFFPSAPVAVLYLDSTTITEEVTITSESGSFPSPLWMVQGLTEAFQKLKLDPHFTGTVPSLFRLDLPERRNAMHPWFQRSIPAVWIQGGPVNLSVVQALQQFSASFPEGLPAYWDRHYLAFDFGSWKFFWGQQTYLLVFLGVAAFLLFGYALLGRSRRGSLRILGHGFWQLPVLLTIVFLGLQAGGLLTDWIQQIRGEPDLWKRAPLMLATLKALVTVTLYLLVMLPFRRTPLSRNPDFYSQAALVWLGLMTLAAAVFELSFSFYFLWALVWAAVLVTVLWRPVEWIALLMGPVWVFKAGYEALGPHPDLELARWVLQSPLAGNFVLAVLFFPFLLQINSWHLRGHREQARNEGLRAGIQLSFWALATISLGFLVLRMEVAPLPPGPPPIERVEAKDFWKTQVARSAFLDRTVWNLRFSGPTAPEEVELELVAEGPLTVYDCSFPFILDAQGHRARIVVGRQSPLPLDLRLTLPKSTKAQLMVRVLLAPEHPLEVIDTIELNP